MSLQVRGVVTLGNLKYEEHLLNVAVTLGILPEVNYAALSLPINEKVKVIIGEMAKLELNGGMGFEVVLTGKIQSVRRGMHELHVVLVDSGALLSTIRPCATFRNLNGREVIRALADAANVTATTINLDLPLAVYHVHQRRTAAEHIAYLASLTNCLSLIDSQGLLQVQSQPQKPADVVIQYKRELIAFTLSQRPIPQAHQVMIGNGPAGNPSAPNALRPSSHSLPADAQSPGINALWFPAPVLRTPTVARAASEAADSRAEAMAGLIRGRTFLLPKLRPGMTVEITGLPDGFSSNSWVLTRVIHLLQPETGGLTIFEGNQLSKGAVQRTIQSRTEMLL